jgi:integrase/recombinase XerD
LKIERVYQKHHRKLYFDVERLFFFLNENEIIISPLKIGEETLQQFIYSVAKEVNARSQARIISGLKSLAI